MLKKGSCYVQGRLYLHIFFFINTMFINTFRLKFSIFLNTMLNTSQPRILAQFSIFSLLFKIISNEINTMLNTFQPEIIIFLNTLILSPQKYVFIKKMCMSSKLAGPESCSVPRTANITRYCLSRLRDEFSAILRGAFTG